MQTVVAGGIAVFVLAVVAAGPIARQGSAHDPAEDAAVRKALGYYFEGHATGQGSAFAKVFHPDSNLFFNRDGRFSQVTSADYIARAPGKPADDEARRKRRIDFVDITGDAAVAKLTLEYPDVTFTDYMSLIKVDGEWQIVNKIFHADRRPG